jgi:multiple sugar transport system permease protein
MTALHEPEAPAAAAPPENRRTLQQRDARTGLLFMTPTLIIIVTLVLVPLAWSFLIAFQRLRLINVGRAGVLEEPTLDNFRRVLSSGELWGTLWTTTVYTAGSTFLAITLGLIVALAVRRPFRGRSGVRAAMMLPYIAPVVAVTFVWRIMLDPEFGVVNDVGRRVFGWDDPIAFLSQAQGQVSVLGVEVTVPTALLTVIVFEGWRYFPFAFLFLLARLQAVPADLEEAARVDGAAPTQIFRHILLPQLGAVIALLSVLRFIMTFNKFDDVYLLTGGGSGTEVVSVRVYEYLTARFDIGAAAAQALVLAAGLVVLLAIYLRFLAPRVDAEEEA